MINVDIDININKNVYKVIITVLFHHRNVQENAIYNAIRSVFDPLCMGAVRPLPPPPPTTYIKNGIRQFLYIQMGCL